MNEDYFRLESQTDIIETHKVIRVGVDDQSLNQGLRKI